MHSYNCGRQAKNERRAIARQDSADVIFRELFREAIVEVAGTVNFTPDEERRILAAKEYRETNGGKAPTRTAAPNVKVQDNGKFAAKRTIGGKVEWRTFDVLDDAITFTKGKQNGKNNRKRSRIRRDG